MPNFNKSRILIILTLLFTLFSGIIGFGLFYQINDTAAILSQFENQYIGRYNEYGDYSNVTEYREQQPEIYLTKFDIFNPKYTVILSDGVYSEPKKPKSESTQFTLFVITMERKNIFNLVISSVRNSVSRKGKIQEVINMVKKTDVSDINNYENITLGHLTPLPPDKIEQNSITPEQKQQQEEREFNALSPEQKIYAYQEQIEHLEDLKAYKKDKPDELEELNKEILDIQALIDQVRKENGIAPNCPRLWVC